jgi:ABC-type dipeptide/oligopeptide/nickel transport system permease component
MRKFLLRRLAESLITLLAITLAVFLMLHISPGDPVLAIFGQASPTAEQYKALRHELGLDKPIWKQYLGYLARLAAGDMGVSFKMISPVRDILLEQLPYTLKLATVGMSISIVFGMIAGIIAAAYRGSVVETAVMGFSIIGVSVPSFWLGLLLMLVFSLHLGWLPAVAAGSAGDLVLPGLTLAMWPAGNLARLVRSSMLEVLRQDYIVTGRSKGLSGRTVLYKHALRNTMIPIVTMIGVLVGEALVGAVVVESVFARPGIGRILLLGIVSKDFPLVQGTVLLIVTLVLGINLLVDMSYGLLDPRIRTDQ